MRWKSNVGIGLNIKHGLVFNLQRGTKCWQKECLCI